MAESVDLYIVHPMSCAYGIFLSGDDDLDAPVITLYNEHAAKHLASAMNREARGPRARPTE